MDTPSTGIAIVVVANAIGVTSGIGKHLLQQDLGVSQPSLVHIKRCILLGLARRGPFMNRNGARTAICGRDRRRTVSGTIAPMSIPLLGLAQRRSIILPYAHPQEVEHRLDVLLPATALDVIVPHVLDVIRLRPKFRGYGREQPLRVPERHDLVLAPVYDERGTADVPRALLVVEEVAHEAEVEAVQVSHDLVYREEWRVEDKTPDRLAVEGRLGSEVAAGAAAEGAPVEDDLAGRDFAHLR
mmetsp:Transcript_21152/g.51075  ORF Transcript_21152/g.51075 Transcript_21152/m.51075 type:complete len:242 (+) Transcript_21152:346-1071(+)